MQHISDRVQAMGFQEATTEIWSVDSQYSKDNGVIVLVTGSLQCKASTVCLERLKSLLSMKDLAALYKSCKFLRDTRFSAPWTFT